jgi:acetyl/propionyl-CoA carboxylase alpha subunit/acetyl-CoA carboxylase carboxyltransferase component
MWRAGSLAKAGAYFRSPLRLCSQKISKLLIANRGEIAIRISRAATEMGIETVGICSQDERFSLHNKRVHTSLVLSKSGPAAYLNSEAIVDLAVRAGCDAIHPGYGFLSENSEFAELCVENGIKFIGPSSQLLKLFGDKARAREVAIACGVPIVPGINAAVDDQSALRFFESLPPGSSMMIKAISGGGGKGMRVVTSSSDIPALLFRCQSEALSSFGDGRVYVEQYIPNARHIEVQVLGDGQDVCLLWERECTLQRNHQKLIEIAPSPSLSPQLKEKIYSAAKKMAISTNYVSLGTFEFLVDLDREGAFYFLETNPRIQVEHTVTEQITGLDLVQLQLSIANKQTLSQLSLLGDGLKEYQPRGYAIQMRVNMETLNQTASDFKATSGLISVFEPPSGIGVRVDSFVYSGYETSSRYDSLIAKLIVHSPSPRYLDCVNKALAALSEFRIEGLATNVPYLLSLLQTDGVQSNNVNTRYVNQHLQALALARLESGEATTAPEERFFKTTGRSASPHEINDTTVEEESALSGDLISVLAPMQGTIIELRVDVTQEVFAGQPLAIMEAMKMQHIIEAPCSGIVMRVIRKVGETVSDNGPLFYLCPAEVTTTHREVTAIDPRTVRSDLQESLTRHSYGEDSTRSQSVKRRHQSGNRTARENIADVCDVGTFLEYGALTIAAQRQRRKFDDLIRSTPADGLVAGIGRVNGSLFPETINTQCIVMAYDYMVLAGTQGLQNHRKKDRMFELAERMRLPVILFAEGGGGRPGDTDTTMIAGLDCMAFALYAKLSGLVPRIGIANGRCFAGNAALLGMSDVIIATENSNIGMGGPAMIEGGGLGVYRPEEIGPIEVQSLNGVVDLVAKDEAEAVSYAKKYLSYFQGPLHLPTSQTVAEAEDQYLLRHIIPENRLQPYDIRRVIEILADRDSILELRSGFGKGIVTAFARVEGKAIGIIANNPRHLGGAIDAQSADKASRFIQLCDAFDLPILTLCDTPGIMVGPEAEKTALVRHVSRLFLNSTTVTVPFFTVVLRKGYGLGAQAMAGGSFKSPYFTVTWPTGEFGGMGLEGAVKLGYKKEIESLSTEAERKKFSEEKVRQLYEVGKAVNYATAFELDEVIDPKETRAWIIGGLRSAAATSVGGSIRSGKKRPMIDSW